MIPKISFHPASREAHQVFSILIPSWNNLPYLKCCVESIRKNSAFAHEIIVHVNEGVDGTLAWVKDQGLSYTHSHENAGVCFGFNAPSALAGSDYLLLSDDDYYYAPGWDRYLFEEVKKVGDPYFCITGTMIEHSRTQYGTSIIAECDFGKTVGAFREEDFLKAYASIPFRDWTGGNWYPMVLHRHTWNMIGGLSTEFSPGMASDPDMMMKLWQCGVRYFKGVGDARVYHFGSRSTARIRKNDGNRQFLRKWGLSPSTFFRAYLRLGDPFTGYTPEPDLDRVRVKLIRDKIKRTFSF
jgi:glycosyltransferase involved in cell wall biosynthesis